MQCTKLVELDLIMNACNQQAANLMPQKLSKAANPDDMSQYKGKR